MEVFLMVLCFINGLVLGAGGVLMCRGGGKKAAQAEAVPDTGQNWRMAAQVENFLNYDGTGRGQRWVQGE